MVASAATLIPMQPAAQSILIVEDDTDIRQLIGELLAGNGFSVLAAGNAFEMDAILERTAPDLLILDVMLPGEDGLSICRRLRPRTAVPILMLTARSEEIDKVLGLELGADDYLVKPFGPRELVARVRALLRRAAGPQIEAKSRRFAFEGLTIDLDACQLLDREGRVVPLTTGEFDLLNCFVQSPRRVLNRDHILDRLRGRTSDPFDRTVDMLVSRLRKRLATALPDVELITTVRNGGYLFTATVRRV